MGSRPGVSTTPFSPWTSTSPLFAGHLSSTPPRLRKTIRFSIPYAVNSKPPTSGGDNRLRGQCWITPTTTRWTGGATAAMEKEVVNDPRHVSCRNPSWALTRADDCQLGALWGVGHLAPDKLIVFNEDRELTRHSRDVGSFARPDGAIPTDSHGRIFSGSPRRHASTGRVGTVVLTAGPPDRAIWTPFRYVLTLRDRYGFRLHVLMPHTEDLLLPSVVGVNLRCFRIGRNYLKAIPAL